MRRAPPLHVTRTGDGPPVVLLHAAASAGVSWRAVIKRLDGAELIAPDLVGDGASPPAADLDEVLADDLAAVRAVIPAPAVLVGHSYGALLALELARAEPGLARALVLIEPVAFHLLAEAPADAGVDAAAGINARCTQLVRGGALDDAAAAFVDHWSGPGTFATLPEAARAAIARTLPKVVAGIAAIERLPSRLRDYTAIDVPTWLVRGSDSPACTRWITSALAEALPRAHRVDLDRVGHMSPVTAPAAIAAVVANALTMLNGTRSTRADCHRHCGP